jgi:hypothetical protein
MMTDYGNRMTTNENTLEEIDGVGMIFLFFLENMKSVTELACRRALHSNKCDINIDSLSTTSGHHNVDVM